MSAVWLCLPSALPDGGTIPLWREKGYKVAVWRDPGAPQIECDLMIEAPYAGAYYAWNTLIATVIANGLPLQWAICAGDDTLPDPRNPAEIAHECDSHFFHTMGRRGIEGRPEWAYSMRPWTSMGVMQPTGDPWADGLGRIIDRIAGSPWIGREFAQRAYGGKGPYFEGYYHMGGDEELKCVAEKLGVYWPRPDLTHMHNWFGRDDDLFNGVTKTAPPYMAKAYGPEEWANYQRVFGERKAAGFPGHEAI